MFWHLWLAHFLGDYPLQPTWVARNKKRPWVLPFHILTHLAVMVAVTYPGSLKVLPALLVLALVHFAIDKGKTQITGERPKRTALYYFIDQGIHIISIYLTDQWIRAAYPDAAPQLSREAAVTLLGFVVLTHVYMVTERILRGGQSAQAESASQSWARLLVRGGLLALLLAGWEAAAAAAFVLQSPYPATRGGLRVLLIDVLATVVTALLVILINGRSP